MNSKFIALLYILASLAGAARAGNYGPVPDSAYLFAYTTTEDEGRGGLRFAWSTDRSLWHAIGDGFAYVKSDYSRWGSEKRMIEPFMFLGDDGMWHAVWALNHEPDGIFAHASTADMVYWGRQTYYVSADDFPLMDRAAMAASRDRRETVALNGIRHSGTVLEVPWSIVDGLITRFEVASYRNSLWNETADRDPERFAGLGPVGLTVKPDPSQAKEISDMLIGVFFEDINYAADGGLYAELVQNRGFEYDPADRQGRDTAWHSRTAWVAEGLDFEIDTVAPLHPNNPHYALLTTDGSGGKLINKGFSRIYVRSGERYDFSMFARIVSGPGGKVTVRIAEPGGLVYGECTVEVESGEWIKYEGVIPARSFGETILEIIPEFAGTIAVDMVSLFPQNTFMGRKNGLRADLAQAIAGLKPRFVRFPGGCLVHGDGIENIYRWQNTVGPPEARVPQRNIWNYHQTAGLGYFEYFQFCEDIGAEPVPVVAAGVPCQNSGAHGHALGGQQGGIPMFEMEAYVQEVLDFIEWANGDKESKWGRVRADAGHPEPFGLKYLGIGNEDLITDVFEERFNMIYQAVREKHPEITVIGTAGPFFEGTDYVEGWRLGVAQGVPILDEHYYQTPGWFIYNQDFYDKYDRSKPKVYLGEYAAHRSDRVSNYETALAEALYLTSLERNGDVVVMSSYAPLLAREGNTQWRPDLIYFNEAEVKPTDNYYVQKLFGNNAGDRYIPQEVVISSDRRDVRSRIAVSVVEDSRTGDVIYKLVNMLPVEVNAQADFSAVGIVEPVEGVVTFLVHDPEDPKEMGTSSRTLPIEPATDLTLYPYSLTVVRVPGAR
ncbi:MAG: alpha-L-arabinofuranosidase [Alistipes sp.]|nr:alpha-L-arabinofuranosidase [Alistipes sp.]